MELKDQLKNVKDAIRQIFEVAPTPVAPVNAAAPVEAPAPTTPTNKYTTADGKVLEIDALEVGKPVVVDGAPAPAGSYDLQDGSKVVVDEAGMISAVTPAQDMGSKFAEIHGKFEAYEQRFAAQTQLIEAQKNELAAQKQAFEKTASIVNQLFEVVEKLANVPSAPPVQQPSGAAFQKQDFASDIVSNLKNIK